MAFSVSNKSFDNSPRVISIEVGEKFYKELQRQMETALSSMTPDQILALVLVLLGLSLLSEALPETALKAEQDESNFVWSYLSQLHKNLPEGKTLGNLDEKILPVKIRRLLPTLLEGHFVERAENILAFGLPGRGKTHFLAALGRELILHHRYPVLFMPTFKLVQQLLTAKRDLRLEERLRELDQFDAVILDDVEAGLFTTDQMALLSRFVSERGGGLLMLGGPDSFEKGNFAKSLTKTA